MIWIIILMLIGILLLFLEIFFVPGTTFVGIIGGIFSIIGIYLAFRDHGVVAGYISLVATLVIFAGLIVIGAKIGVWQKLSNKDAITSKANVLDDENLKTGTAGESISALRPSGKARFSGKNYEVTTFGEYVEPGTPVEIIQVNANKIFVKTSGNA